MEKNAVGKGVEGHIGTGIVTHTHTHKEQYVQTLYIPNFYCVSVCSL